MILIACVTWGYGYVVIRDSLSFLPQDLVMSLRYILAAAAMEAVFFRRFRHTTRRIVAEGAVMGAFLYASQYSYSQTAALGTADTTVGQVAFITALYVVLVPFLGWAFQGRRPDAGSWAAAALAAAGLYLLVQGGMGVTRGCLLALLGSVGFSFHILAIDWSTARDDPILLTAWQFIWAAVFSTLVQLLRRTPFPAPAALADGLWPLLYLGIFNTLLSFLMQTEGQKRLPPHVAAVLLSTEALFGMLFSVLLTGEPLTARKVMGCGILFAAVLLAELRVDQGKLGKIDKLSR